MTTERRRQFSATQKIGILRRHLLEQVPVSDLCDQSGIHPTMFYRWQTQLFENGGVVFQRDADRQKARLARTILRLKEKLAKKNEVLSELMEEHLELKKRLGDV